MDIFVANDNRPNFLFHNLGGKKFEEVALESGVAYAQNGSAISGMGADFKDVDNDGRPDIWHTAVENESFPLFQNRRRRPVPGEDCSSAPGWDASHVRMGKWHFRFR